MKLHIHPTEKVITYFNIKKHYIKIFEQHHNINVLAFPNKIGFKTSISIKKYY